MLSCKSKKFTASVEKKKMLPEIAQMSAQARAMLVQTGGYFL
jgi:hypothetical protein